MNVCTSSLERGSRPGRRLVQQQQRRARQDRPGDRDLLLHAPAHLLDRPAHPLLADAEPGHDLDRLAACLAGVEPVEAGREREVLGRRELLEEGGVDADPIDQPLDRHLLADQVVAEDLDPALVERQQAADETDEGGLAAAVGAEQAVDLAPLDPDRDVVHGHDRRLAAVHLKRLVACSTSRAAGPATVAGGPAGSGPAMSLVPVPRCSCHLPAVVGSRRWRTASRVGAGMGSRLALEGASAPRRGHQKSRGPDLAHGSEVRPGGSTAWV